MNIDLMNIKKKVKEARGEEEIGTVEIKLEKLKQRKEELDE